MPEVKIGIGTIVYTDQELRKEIEDLIFLRDAFLTLLNPEVCEKSDLPFDLQDTLKFAKEMYQESTTYSQDFIERCFEGKIEVAAQV